MFLRNWARLYTNMTVSERMLEDEIKKLGERYRAQHPFFRHRLIADFALLDRKIVVEVDGASHLTDAQHRKDVVHMIALERDGWAVVRVTNAEVTASPAGALSTAFERLSHRKSLSELESELSLLPLPAPKRPSRATKRRGPGKVSGPKKARGRKPRGVSRAPRQTPLNSDTPLLER